MDRETQKSIDALILKIGNNGVDKSSRIQIAKYEQSKGSGLIKHEKIICPGYLELIEQEYAHVKATIHSNQGDFATLELNNKGRERYLMISGKTMVEYETT